MDFLVKRDDLHQTRVEEGEKPEVADGEALLEVGSFGLTANNITYCVFGDAMNYWDFFPAEEGWGHMPTWGFAEVAESKADDLEKGQRVYGYLPPTSYLHVVPDRIDERGFNDGAPHRKPLPSAYQGYRATSADPIYQEKLEDAQILFWPLFYTSFMIDDQLADDDFYGAGTMLLSSASSKTALIAAYLLAQRGGVDVIGLTSPGNKEFVEGLGIYGHTATYDEIGELPQEKSVYVDFSGDGAIRAAVHDRLAENLVNDTAVGMTHWDQMAVRGDGELKGAKPVFFFAPDRIKKRGVDWGTAKLDQNVSEAWTPFAEWASGWLEVNRVGGDQLEATYLEVLEGKIDPKSGHVVELG
jgi:hypothetical protein